MGNFINKEIKQALLLSALCLFLCSCGKTDNIADQQVAGDAETGIVTENPIPADKPKITIGTMEVDEDVEVLDFSDAGCDIDALCLAAPRLSRIKQIELGFTDAEPEKLNLLSDVFPDAEIKWTVKAFGKEFENSAESVDLIQCSSDDLDEIISLLKRLNGPEVLLLADEEGSLTSFAPDEVARIAEIVPSAEIHCRYELFGLTADWNTSELRYFKNRIGDAGIEQFRAVLPYLYSLELLRLERCEIADYDGMVELNNEFPDVNIVWSVDFLGYTFMTDTTLMNTPLLRDNNVYMMKYFPNVLYLDIGHNRSLSNIDFVKYFPNLTTVIVSLTSISDLSPLTACPNIEFLECFTTKVSDISCLAELENLEYLNLGNNLYLEDLTPLYNLKKLKIVRLCGETFVHVTREDAEQLQKQLPDCFVSTVGGHSANSGNWRYKPDGSLTERYALLREQMKYDYPWEKRQTNSPSAAE